MTIVPIIIPFYKAHEKLDLCLAAIKSQSFQDFEIFVRDNSLDNVYYTAAINEGLLKYAYRDDVRYLLILNHDANLRRDTLDRLVAHMDQDPNCGIACPVQFDSASGRTSWAGSQQAFPFGIHALGAAENAGPFETFWANGAAMLIRAAVVKEVGLFDKNLRFIGSDADFSFSARTRGWKVMVVPDAIVDHAIAASADRQVDELMLIKTQDMIYFGEKWISGGLYKRLAFEGPQLTPLGVKHTLKEMADFIALNRHLLTPPG